jgi:hypothetical protein
MRDRYDDEDPEQRIPDISDYPMSQIAPEQTSMHERQA